AHTRLRPEIIPNVPVNANTPSVDHGEVRPPVPRAPMSWARLLTKPPAAVLNGERRPEGRSHGGLRKRVFESDIEQCPSAAAP
ncbi:MAG: hypothetical protein ACREBC_18515, partial [Pyrinomonadaceae bacterium]